VQPEIELHSKLRDIHIEYDKVVIGSSLEALVYCYLNNVPFVCSQLSSPFRFEYFNWDDDLSIFGAKNIAHPVKSNLGETTRGIDKLWLWERLFFYLSVAGLCPLSDKATSLRISDNIIKATTPNARMAKIHFNELIVFDDTSVLGLGVPEIKDKIYTVYDWFDVRSGMKHEYDRLEDTTDFVNHILFYPSQRVEGNHHFKDVVAVSYLTKEMIDLFEYSDINARFKTFYMMKKAGIKGARNGRDMLDKNRYKYYSIKIENDRREIIKKLKKYNSSERYIFNYESVDAIIKTLHLESDVSRIFRKYIYR